MSFDVDRMLADLWHAQLPSFNDVRRLCELLRTVLMKESNVLELQSPVSIVGDIHGQFFDLLEMFRVSGPVPHVNYLFLGNYVDRGDRSLETVLLLLCLKLKYPRRVFLLRGNHETRHVTQIYGFYDECISKYGSAAVWRELTSLFDCLTLSALIDKGGQGGVFCVHAGLSAGLAKIDNVRVLDRFREVPLDGYITDLLWSDPSNQPTMQEASKSGRGLGRLFGVDVIQSFCQTNHLFKIVRGHQLAMDGYSEFYRGKVITVWSAPNFLGNVGNLASVMELFDGRHDRQSERFNIFGPAPQSDRVAYRAPEWSASGITANFPKAKNCSQQHEL